MPIALPDYIKFVKSLEAPAPIITTTVEPKLNWGRLVHSALGLTTEALELYDSKSKGVPAQLAELGDICFFAAMAMDELQNFDIPREIPASLDNLLMLIETFGSRVKSGIFYGVVKKDTDKYLWRTLPPRIFHMAIELGKRGNYDVLQINVDKLGVRYPDKKFNAEATTTRRDVVKEDKVIAESAKAQPIEPPPV